MSANVLLDPVARVLVPLAAATSSREALETAAGLAAAVGARLEGLFVEDPNLARLSALPFAREVESLTAAERRLAPAAVERALRVEAAHLARLLAESAGRARVECTFEVTRGAWRAEIAAREAELTVLVGTRRGGVERRDRRLRRPVAVLFDASAAGQRGLFAASRLARANERELVILVPSADPASVSAARTEASAWLLAQGQLGRAMSLVPTAESLFAALRTLAGSALALPEPALAALDVDVETLAAHTPCTIILVR
jgi:nucleotide-binding universal stress UspA family protein